MVALFDLQSFVLQSGDTIPAWQTNSKGLLLASFFFWLFFLWHHDVLFNLVGFLSLKLRHFWLFFILLPLILKGIKSK